MRALPSVFEKKYSNTFTVKRSHHNRNCESVHISLDPCVFNLIYILTRKLIILLIIMRVNPAVAEQCSSNVEPSKSSVKYNCYQYNVNDATFPP